VIPDGPGADLLEVHTRLQETSSSVIGSKPQGGRGAGSSGSESGMGLGTVGKKRLDRTCRRSVWEVAKEPSSFRSGGILFAHLPCHQAVAFHRVSRVTVVRLSLDQPRFASVIVRRSALMASLRDSPQMEATLARVASQCRFHQWRPRNSGVCQHLNSFPEMA